MGARSAQRERDRGGQPDDVDRTRTQPPEAQSASRRRRPPGAARCPACGEPLFVWLETEGWGPREDQVIDRCENCGLVVARDHVPSASGALAAARRPRMAASSSGQRRQPPGLARGRELGGASPRRPRSEAHPAGGATAARREMASPAGRIRQPGGARDRLDVADAAQPAHLPPGLRRPRRPPGRLRPDTGRGRAAFSSMPLVTVLAAIPTALLAVAARGRRPLIARRGGVIEISARRFQELGLAYASAIRAIASGAPRCGGPVAGDASPPRAPRAALRSPRPPRGSGRAVSAQVTIGAGRSAPARRLQRHAPACASRRARRAGSPAARAPARVSSAGKPTRRRRRAPVRPPARYSVDHRRRARPRWTASISAARSSESASVAAGTRPGRWGSISTAPGDQLGAAQQQVERDHGRRSRRRRRPPGVARPGGDQLGQVLALLLDRGAPVAIGRARGSPAAPVVADRPRSRSLQSLGQRPPGGRRRARLVDQRHGRARAVASQASSTPRASSVGIGPRSD